MKRYVLTVVLLFATFSQVQAEDFWHDSVRACVVGGGVIGASSALLLYSATAAATSGATMVLPAGTIVIGNTIFGCGLGTIGTMIVYGVGSVYQNMTSSLQTPSQPELPSQDSTTKTTKQK